MSTVPFIAKINHNELLTYPNKFQQILFGSDDADREIVEVPEVFR